jgi:hypothetical protein
MHRGTNGYARVDPTNRPFGVTCMHGDIECQGNIQQLCAATYHPQEQWWPFVQCQNAAGRYSVGDPELAQRCAVEAGIDWDGYAAGRCAVVGDEGAAEEGRGLLQASAVKTASLGIRFVYLDLCNEELTVSQEELHDRIEWQANLHSGLDLV